MVTQWSTKPVDGRRSASTAAAAASLVVKPTPGRLFGFTVYNDRATAQFIQLHDAAALPANNAVPKAVFEIAAQTARTLDFGEAGRNFTTGIVIANSTTDTTLTIGSADCLIDAQYE